jgi:hypothetical protein
VVSTSAATSRAVHWKHAPARPTGVTTGDAWHSLSGSPSLERLLVAPHQETTRGSSRSPSSALPMAATRSTQIASMVGCTSPPATSSPRGRMVVAGDSSAAPPGHLLNGALSRPHFGSKPGGFWAELLRLRPRHPGQNGFRWGGAKSATPPRPLGVACTTTSGSPKAAADSPAPGHRGKPRRKLTTAGKPVSGARWRVDVEEESEGVPCLGVAAVHRWASRLPCHEQEWGRFAEPRLVGGSAEMAGSRSWST